METEKSLQTRLHEHLKKLPCLDDKRIGMEVPIPYKHIYLPTLATSTHLPNLEVWCFKQDIAIYDVLYDKTVGYKTAKVVHGKTDVVGVTLEKDNVQHTASVGLPYVIIETKKSQPVTDTLLAYSQKAEMIKTIFPFCKYVLVIFGRISPRTYRHGLNFDAILQINVHSLRDMRLISSLVCALLKESLDEARRLRPLPKVARHKRSRRALRR